MRPNAWGLLGLSTLLSLTSGCSLFMGKPKAPFDQMKEGSMVAYRLDPYEAPAAPVAGAAAPAAAIPGLPPQLQQLLQQGAQGLEGLQQIIPPGLIPPGLLGGLAAPGTAAPAPAPVASVPRFPDQAPNYRILSQTQVIDPKLKKDLGRLFGRKRSFDNNHANCFLPELGIRWGMPPAAPNDLLISFSCNQVAPRGFIWPHPSVGMKPDTVKQLAKISNRVFPPGT
jgi:hypothetical protein